MKYKKITCVIAAVCLMGTSAFCSYHIYDHYAHQVEQSEAFEDIAKVMEQAKDKAEQGYYADENSATEYATDRVSNGAERITEEGIHQFDKQGQKSVKTTKENIVKAKDKLAAGGWIAVVVIIVICLIGLLVGSVFGIFFSGEESGSGMTMQTATPHDVLEMSNSRAVWKDVLAIYSVKTTTDPDNPQEVATMDEKQKGASRKHLLGMNEISSRTENKTETVIEESDDGHGNIVQTESTVTSTSLYITVSHKTAEEMADKYHFNADQRKQLAEPLEEKNNSLWSQVLYDISAVNLQ